MAIITDRVKLKMIEYLILDYSISTSLGVFWNNDILAYFYSITSNCYNKLVETSLGNASSWP